MRPRLHHLQPQHQQRGRGSGVACWLLGPLALAVNRLPSCVQAMASIGQATLRNRVSTGVVQLATLLSAMWQPLASPFEPHPFTGPSKYPERVPCAIAPCLLSPLGLNQCASDHRGCCRDTDQPAWTTGELLYTINLPNRSRSAWLMPDGSVQWRDGNAPAAQPSATYSWQPPPASGGFGRIPRGGEDVTGCRR